MTNDVNQFLNEGAKGAKFETVGDKVQGIVADFQLRDQTEFGTNKVKTYDDGNPMKQVVITVQTKEREDEDDDGRRRVYARGQMLQELRKAVSKEGGLHIGGKLGVKYVGNGEAKKGMNPPKHYAIFYKAPEESDLVAAAVEMGAQPVSKEEFDFDD